MNFNQNGQLRPVPKLLLLVSFLVGLFTLSACVSSPGGGSGTLQPGDELPAFYLKTPGGEAISSDDLKGKPAVISVFATWCPPCKIELKEFESELWQPLKDSGVHVIGINYGDEDADQISSFANELGVTFPLLVDEEGEFRSGLGIRGIPQSYVVDKDGRIQDVFTGYTDQAVASMKRQLSEGL